MMDAPLEREGHTQERQAGRQLVAATLGMTRDKHLRRDA